MAADDLYRRLQRHLDRMPVGFPATASGVELRILERLFPPAEARVALELSAVPEPVSTIHRRLRREWTREELCACLEAMAARGLIERHRGRRGARYGKAMLAVGIYERQLPHLTVELERDMRAYAAEAFGQALHAAKTPQLRTVPIQASLGPVREVAAYDDIRQFVRTCQGPFAVMACICRKGKDLLGDSCHQTAARDSCLTFGAVAEGMVAGGPARFITREAMLDLLDEADREGLVLQPQNTQVPLFICCCCGCCCGVLTTARRMPEPARYFSASYVAEVEAARCEACGACLSRCQMDAIEFDTGLADVAPARCIGCGLCVTTCPSGAVTLKPTGRERVPPPADTPSLYSKIFLERFGKWAAAVAAGRYLTGRKI